MNAILEYLKSHSAAAFAVLLMLVCGAVVLTYAQTRLPQMNNRNSRQCTVAVIPLYGNMDTIGRYNDPSFDGTTSTFVVNALEQAENEPLVQAAVLEVDSGGGSPVAAEEIADELKAMHKPTVAWIRGQGASAAYWAASGAGHIIASEQSDVGSIGVTSSYLDNAAQDENNGIHYNQLSIGKYKDTFSPDKPLTEDESKLILRDDEIVYNNFVETVSRNRNISSSSVQELADGSTMLGRMALEKHLIDEIGGKAQVSAYLKKQYGITPVFCPASMPEGPSESGGTKHPAR